jgi:hypothetical protein
MRHQSRQFEVRETLVAGSIHELQIESGAGIVSAQTDVREGGHRN